jgi:BirA family transcriptional regulator, biotin operon repressor / biotin---[acetyl-CoA-carboxylase] ligase
LIEIVTEIGSTNSALRVRLAAGEALVKGNWLIADRQNAGRGRAGRVWSGGLGNFMGSTAVFVRASDPPAATLALAAGVAVHEAVSASAPGLAELRLKWPNDLLVGGAKLAGILLERQGDCVIVGIGVNLAEAPSLPDRQTAALALLGYPLPRDDFAERLAGVWAQTLARWHLGEWPALREEWLARAHPVGTLFSAHDALLGAITGGFEGLDPDGAALLRLADGTMRAIHAGDVDLVGD